MGFSDPAKVFYVSQMLKGYNKVGFRLDTRLPITLPILDKLISASLIILGKVLLTKYVSFGPCVPWPFMPFYV